MNPKSLTKSKYVTFMRCKKKAWYDEFKKIEVKGDSQAAINGNLVGELARKYFGSFTLLDKDSSMPKTPGVYCEAPLKHKNLYCAVDLLRVNDDLSIDLYEVKSVTKNELVPKYLYDLSFQYYVAIQCGYNVNGVHLVTLNKNYVYDGSDQTSPDFVQNVFTVTDYTKEVQKEFDNVGGNIKSFFELDDSVEPDCSFSGYCKENNSCVYLDSCKQYNALPSNFSVYDLYDCKNVNSLIKKGIKSFKQLYLNETWDDLTEFNKRLVAFQLLDINEPYVDKTELGKFMKKIKFPIYFFDFETINPPLPIFKNSHPYDQIPFQYSLHIMNSPSDTMEDVKTNHFGYLGDGETDPREELIKQMLDELGTKGSIVAYNVSFEKTRIEELAEAFPKYKNKLEKLLKRFVDLQNVFEFKKELDGCFERAKENGRIKKDINGNPEYEKATFATSIVYVKAMYNSTSIKYVLPALYPNNPEFDYSKLNQVHKGDEASEAYLTLSSLTDPEKAELRNNMIKYCALDTFAMVAIYFKLLDYLS